MNAEIDEDTPSRQSLSFTPTDFPIVSKTIPPVVLCAQVVRLADVSRPNSPAKFTQRVAVAKSEGHLMDFSALDGRLQHVLRLGDTSCQWLFTKNVLAIIEGADGLFCMKRIRCRNSYRIDIGAGTEVPVVLHHIRYAKALRNRSASLYIRSTDGNHFGLRMRLQSWYMA